MWPTRPCSLSQRSDEMQRLGLTLVMLLLPVLTQTVHGTNSGRALDEGDQELGRLWGAGPRGHLSKQHLALCVEAARAEAVYLDSCL
jgi:hypothetical protein